MSVSVTINLECDGCGSYIPAMTVTTYKNRWVVEAKQLAHRAGWMVGKTTILCPECKEKFLQLKGD